MAIIKVFCELCGQIMGTANIGEIKSFQKKYGDKCDECLKMEQELKSFIEKRRGNFNNKFNQLVKECQEYMEKEIKDLLDRRTQQFEMRLVIEEQQRREKMQKLYDDVQNYTAEEQLKVRKDDGE